MDGRAYLAVALSLWVSVLSSGTQAPNRRPAEADAEIPGLSITLGTLSITSEKVILRCEIRNDSEDDVWIYAEGPEDRRLPRTKRSVVFVGTDGGTLMVLRRMKRPVYNESPTGPFLEPSAAYRRLRAGQCRAESMSAELPIDDWLDMIDRGFTQATDSGVRTAERLVFEIGCYTARSLKTLMTYRRAWFEESGDEVRVSESNWSRERAIRLEVEGVTIPYETWVDVGTRKRMRAPQQVLEDMFYRFSLGLEEYRVAQRLFAIDESLLNAKGRQMRDMYVQVAEGKLTSAELVRDLHAIGSEGEREQLLGELERAQAAADQEIQSQVADLLGRAKRLDGPAEGLKALDLLREVLAIDPSHDETFDLMEKISAYYRGKIRANSIGMELVWIPAGEFVMGKEGHLELPRHTVRISGGFWMGIREVTCGEYQAIMGENANAADATATAVRDVSWHDAQEFCRRLGEKEGRSYRLPTEAEWEYACRAGTSTDYWWGDDPEADPCTPNPFGLLAMHRGVAEWCQDVAGPAYYVASPTLDPQGPFDENRRVRVFRGGRRSARYAGNKYPSYYCDATDPEAKYDNLGFRVVLECSHALDQQSLISTCEAPDCQGL